VVLPAAQYERFGHHDVQIHKVGHDPCPCRYLPTRDIRCHGNILAERDPFSHYQQ
jgi:hypothetical protein